MKSTNSNPIIIDLEQTGLLCRSEPLDYETMEALGYFHAEFALVPRSWAKKHWSTWDRDPEDFRGPFCIWWANQAPLIHARTCCDFFWQRAAPDGYYLRDDVWETAWAAEIGHTLEMTQNLRGEITELGIRVDLRNDWSNFIDQVGDLTSAVDCVLLDYESGELVDPTANGVTRRLIGEASSQAIIHRSRGRH